MTSVFLSYARGDDCEPFDPDSSFVARLQRDLAAAGFDVWFDRLSMPSRGLTFHQEIRDAIRACDRLLLVVGPNAAVSEYVQQEWQFAWFEAEKVVTPILRRGDYPLVPDELKLLHCEDFRDDAQYGMRLANLVRQLSEPPPALGKLIGVPSLPAHYLSRTDRLIPLRDAVRSGLDSPAPFGGVAARQQFHGIVGTSRHVGMHGMGGIGKSVLANLLAHDSNIREAFPDGIVWVGLGSVPHLADLMRRIHRELGGDGAFATEQEGKTKLQESLADKAVLLVIDDAWRRQDVDAFDVLGPRCRALITTRDAGLLTSLGGTQHVVELLTDAEALRLLAVAAGKELAELPAAAHDVLQQCGRLPLAVALAGGMVAAGTPWIDVYEALRDHELEFVSDEHRPEQHQDLWKMIEVSIHALKESDRLRLTELAVFPEDAGVPDAAVSTLWASTGGLSGRQSRKMLVELKQRSLVQIVASAAGPVEGETTSLGRVSTHDLIHDYCVRRAQAMYGNVSSLHDKLLAAYRAKCADGWHTGPNDGYFFEHLLSHLVAAGHAAEAVNLLKNLNWLGVKTRVELVFDLALDLLDVHRDLPEADRKEFLPWYYFVRQNAPFLSEHPECFFQQAYNEPVDSPVSQAAQQRWADVTEGRSSGRSSCNDVPEAWLEWTNRSTTWQPPACLMTLFGNNDNVYSVAITPDGETVISGSRDKTVKIWDLRTGACRQTLSGHSDHVTSVAVTRDGGTVVSGSEDQTVKIWDARTGKCRQTICGHNDRVNSVAITHDGETVVSGSRDNTVKLWDARTGACRCTLAGHNDIVCSVAVTADGGTVVSGSRDNTIKIWDARTGVCRRTLSGHNDIVSSVAMTPDGRTIVSGSADKTITIWDAWTGACRHKLTRHNSSVCSVAVTQDGGIVVSGSRDNTIMIWDARAGAYRNTLSGHSELVNSVAVTAEGGTVVSGSWDKTVKIWDASAGTCRQILPGHSGRIESVAVTPDGGSVVSGSSDRTVKFWDARTHACRHTLAGHAKSVSSVAVRPDGWGVVSGSWDKTVKIWDMRIGACLHTLSGHDDWIRSVAMTADGGTVVSGSGDELNGIIKIWDASTGVCHHTLYGHTDGVSSVAVTPDGRSVVSGSGGERNGTVKVWDVQTGECLATHSANSDAARSARAQVGSQGAFDLSPRGGHVVFRVNSSEGAQLFSLAGPGPFDRAYGPLADDTILAFTANGEAYWFRVRRRDRR